MNILCETRASAPQKSIETIVCPYSKKQYRRLIDQEKREGEDKYIMHDALNGTMRIMQSEMENNIKETHKKVF